VKALTAAPERVKYNWQSFSQQIERL